MEQTEKVWFIFVSGMWISSAHNIA